MQSSAETLIQMITEHSNSTTDLLIPAIAPDLIDGKRAPRVSRPASILNQPSRADDRPPMVVRSRYKKLTNREKRECYRRRSVGRGSTR